MSHPYEQFEGTPIDDLVENNAIEETTRREYLVGYLCKLINESVTKNN